jgi:Mn-containing catalase
MFKRIDKLLIDLPRPDYPDANAAAAVQELLGGEFGEMSTLNNYMFQSFNFRQKQKLKPFYELVASITAEEMGHVELVANTINLMIEGTTFAGGSMFLTAGISFWICCTTFFLKSEQEPIKCVYMK